MSKITCHVDESCLRHFVSKREPQPFMGCEYAMRIYHLLRTPLPANHFFGGSPYILVHNCTSILRSYLSPDELVIELNVSSSFGYFLVSLRLPALRRRPLLCDRTDLKKNKKKGHQ